MAITVPILVILLLVGLLPLLVAGGIVFGLASRHGAGGTLFVLLLLVLAGLWLFSSPEASAPPPAPAAPQFVRTGSSAGPLLAEAPGTIPLDGAETAEPAASAGSEPAWVQTPPPPTVGPGTFRTVVSTGFVTRREYAGKLDQVLRRALDEYLETELGGTPASRAATLDQFDRRSVIAEQFTQSRHRTVGDEDVYLFNTHALVQIDDPRRGQLVAAWQAHEVQRRLWLLGSTAGAALVALGAALGYLRLDTYTRGYYTRRLALAAGGLALAAALVAWRLCQARLL